MIHAQYSPEWFADRLGKVTASHIVDVTARTKSGWSASRANYMAQLICEQLTGTVADSYINASMQWGIDTEPKGLLAYEFYTDAKLEDLGVVDHPTIAMSSACPDKGVIADGLVEIKCPNSATHIDTLLSGTIPDKYQKQMLWQMACTGRKWCDFVSYDPRMPEDMALFVKRLHRDDREIRLLEHAVKEFIQELDQKIEALRRRTGDIKPALRASVRHEDMMAQAQEAPPWTG